ncbi:MAG: hypothetical protein ACHRXM_16110 [Isosphaerales bacterium]
MDQGPLVREEAEAGGELVRRLDAYFPVKAAFWLKDSEEGRWYLYIASGQINDNTLNVAYGEVLRLADEMANPYMDPFQVKLIPASDPRSQAALDIHRRYPAKIATRLGGTNFGGMGLSEVYLYPASITAPAQ